MQGVPVNRKLQSQECQGLGNCHRLRHVPTTLDSVNVAVLEQHGIARMPGNCFGFSPGPESLQNKTVHLLILGLFTDPQKCNDLKHSVGRK